MPEGKLHIKGTITIKGGKEDKEEKKGKKSKRGKKEISIKGLKQRKPRKQKGTGSGVAFTNQSFEQQANAPYTAQALMASLALRPQNIYPQEQFKAPEMQQPALDQPKYFSIEEYSTAPEGSMIGIKKEDVKVKIVPMLEYAQQQGLERGRQNLLDLEQELIGTREKIKRAQETEQELTQKVQFMEDGMEQAEASFQKQIADLEQVAKSEREKMRLELLSERAKADASIVMEGLLGKIELEAEKAKSQQEIKQLKQKSQQEIEEQKKISRIESIRELETTKLEQAIGRIDRTYTFIPEEGKTKRDILRDKLIELEGLKPTAEKMEVKVPLKRGRPPKQRQPSANEEYIQQLKQKASQETKLNEKLMKQLQEEQLNKEWLTFSGRKEQFEQKLETIPKESSLSRTLPNYVKTPYGMMTEERAKQEFGTMNPFRLQQAEALDLAGTVQGKKKFGYMV